MRRGTGDRHTWGSLTAKDIRESVWTVSLRGIPPKSAAWGLSADEERTQHPWLPLPGSPAMPVPVMATRRGQRLPGSSCTAARQPC